MNKEKNNIGIVCVKVFSTNEDHSHCLERPKTKNSKDQSSVIQSESTLHPLQHGTTPVLSPKYLIKHNCIANPAHRRKRQIVSQSSLRVGIEVFGGLNTSWIRSEAFVMLCRQPLANTLMREVASTDKVQRLQ